MTAPSAAVTNESSVLWRRAEDIAAVVHPGHTVVLGLRTHHLLDEPRPLVLAGSAHTIWSVLEQPMTTASLVHSVAEETGADADDLTSVITDFLGRLVELGLVCTDVPTSDEPLADHHEMPTDARSRRIARVSREQRPDTTVL